MSDLISRSELLTAFNCKNIQITFDLPVKEVLGEYVDLDNFAMLVQDAIQVYKKMVIDTIKNMPTAYSVDKIAELLEELKANRIALEKANGYLEANYRLGYNKAIDDFVILMKETLNHDWATTKISEQIIYNRLFDKCNEIAEQLKAGMENDT